MPTNVNERKLLTKIDIRVIPVLSVCQLSPFSLDTDGQLKIDKCSKD